MIQESLAVLLDARFTDSVDLLKFRLAADRLLNDLSQLLVGKDRVNRDSILAGEFFREVAKRCKAGEFIR